MREGAISQKSILRPLLFGILLLVFIGLARYFHLEHYFEKERLHQTITGYGIWGPLVYLAIWTIAPSLMIPGTVLVVAGGALFGPFWGEIYVILGATLGATVSFVIARYLARDWVASKLSGTKLAALDQLVAQNGWKIVAITRLIPIFPYGLVNYAFGLTNVSISGFVLATLVGIIPLTAAYVYLSASLVDLLFGKMTYGIFIGVFIAILVIIILAFCFKTVKGKRIF